MIKIRLSPVKLSTQGTSEDHIHLTPHLGKEIRVILGNYVCNFRCVHIKSKYDINKGWAFRVSLCQSIKWKGFDGRLICLGCRYVQTGNRDVNECDCDNGIPRWIKIRPWDEDDEDKGFEFQIEQALGEIYNVTD